MSMVENDDDDNISLYSKNSKLSKNIKDIRLKKLEDRFQQRAIKNKR